MNALSKSVFIAIFPIVAIIAMIDSIVLIFQSEFSMQYFGHLMTAASISFFFIIVNVKPIPRTDTILIRYTFFVFLGCISSFIIGNLHDEINVKCTVLNFALTFSWILYLVWYSYFQERNAKKNSLLKIGLKLPELFLETTDGEVVSSRRFASTPSIFIFYRGNWCSFCMAQIEEMISKHDMLTDRNINTIFISSQPRNFTEKLTKKYSLDFQFLVDVDGKVATQLNILSKNGLPFGFQLFGFKSDITLPTVIITDADEKIIYTNQTDNYRVRPEPSELLKVIDANI